MKRRAWVLIVTAPMVLGTAFVAACGGDDDAGGGGTTNANDGGGGNDGTTSGDSNTAQDTGSKQETGNAETLTFTKLASFTAAAGELPEGLVVSGGTPIVGFAPVGRVSKILPDGGQLAISAFSSPSQTYTLGLALNAVNDIYVAVAATGGSPSPAPGVYKIPSAGGAPGPYNTTGDAGFGFTNGLDPIGTDLFVADSSGKIIKIDQSGDATEWKVDNELKGDVAACNSQNGFPIGVNGIAHDDTYVYAVNLDKGSFLRIKRNADGTAGPVEILFKGCDFFGADGMVRDVDGTFIVANNAKNRIDRVKLGTNNASYKTIGQGAPLDGPASVFVEGTGAGRKLWVTNSAFGSAAVDAATATPSLVYATLN